MTLFELTTRSTGDSIEYKWREILLSLKTLLHTKFLKEYEEFKQCSKCPTWKNINKICNTINKLCGTDFTPLDFF